MNPLGAFYTLRSYVSAYAGLLGQRFISLIWVVAICVVIWFYGSMAGYGGFKPLSSSTARMIAIGVIIAGWLIYMLATTLRARKRDKALVEGIADDAASQQAEVGEIHSRLKEALLLLRRISKKRFGYIYELPWYVIFGAPGSGKTTALTNSGLKFPLGDAMGSNSVQGAGGTRNCNWWFADEAILIDTAGRYTTQDDLNGASKAGWEGFLGLLRKYRRSQPINGALVTLSIGDLLSRDHEAQLEEVRSIRKRLSELDEFLHARVPVYVVLTKADLLTGFVEFFDGLAKTDREQVWGTTFNLDESYKGENLPERFMEEFALLQQRVDAMLIERLQQEPNIEVRGRIFRFPAELASLGERLQELLTELCASSSLIESPLVRGVYFASGTQSRDTDTPHTRRSYFLSRLFKEVIFGEASLVARDRRLSGRQAMIRRIAYGAAAIALAIVFTGWTATYFQNSRAIAAAERRIDSYEKLASGIQVRDVTDADFLRVLPALDNLRAVNSGFDEARIWPTSFGLDQGDKIASRQRGAYQRALNALLLPRMLVALQTELKQTSDVQKTFDALKLYGMLGGLGPVDGDFVAQQSEDMFAALYPGEGRSATRKALAAHAEAMAAGSLPAIELDNALIAKARETIHSQSLAARTYDILIHSRQARQLDAWLPTDALGPLGAQIFQRKSKSTLREGIPGIFTSKGYRDVVLPMVATAASEALKEQWVRGDGGAAPSTMTTDAISQATLQLYFDAFQQQWSSLLADLQVRPSSNLADATETARILAANPSPVEMALKSIAAATDLRPHVGAEIASLDDVPDAALTAATTGAVSAPDPYGPLRAALEANAVNAQPSSQDGNANGNDKPRSQIQSLQPILQNIYGQLSRAANSTAEVARVFDAGGQLANANQDLLQQARGLPAPADAWMVAVAADIGSLAVKTARARINDLWAAEGADLCARIVTGRYPFDRKSSQDIAMADFIRLFGPQGLFQSFFKNRLDAFVDTSAQPWGWRGTFGGDSIPSQAIAQFENASKIEHAFFPAGSEKPSISINIKPVSLSDNANSVMVDIVGEHVLYNHGQIVPKSITWPPAGAVNQSNVRFFPGDLQPAITQTGDWSPFRLFDAAKVTVQAPDLFRARFEDKGQMAEFDVQFGSVLNPFRLQALSDFSCPGQF
ncbi:type VI secretion protein IcmF [Rhizobium sp. NBRC 114257]|uniref:Type VI secretion protein IcmF n=1 Tax=Rhizobium dioscoreae TaxID=2653122 RepID=A0ABQ0ZA46_9HYPH|nr:MULTISPECIES: type VI secretion system membrane subunit TssM [Rhizobium]GES52123.1 type VI secretion protein IcmF [Rhizobium dioscoreae]GLU83158.1 type VI secretion protein IcmF [Rhizobium sp. NBRC 114257]